MTLVSSHEQTRALSVLVYKPTIVSGVSYTPTGEFRKSYIGSLGGFNIIWQALGGYWSFSFNIDGDINEVEYWLEEGLGNHIEIYSPSLVKIWEGFASQVSANIGGLSLQRGPLLNTVANKIKCVYSTVDTAVDPPAVGSRTSTAWYSDTTSQGKYGVIERVISIGGIASGATGAAQIAQTALAELKEPATDEKDNLSSSSIPSVTVTCLGYNHWFKAYTVDLTTNGLQNLDTKMQAVLGADPSVLFSTDYGDITANATQVAAYEQRDRTAWNVIKGLVALGDSSYNRYLFGTYSGRKVKYAAIPTDIKYQRSLVEPVQTLRAYNIGNTVDPWDVTPGEWVFYTDLLIGRTQPSDMRDDPRNLLIEQATYRVPWALTLDGGKVARLDQLIGQLGLRGAGA